MGEERTTCNRPGYDLGRVEDRGRQDVEKVLSEPPDGRGISEELMRIQIEAAVIAVPEIEMPVEHEHFIALEIFEGFLSNLVSFVHAVIIESVLFK
jgi:hypothetical protein